MTTDPLAAAIDHIRSITPGHSPWTEYDVSSFSPWEPDESDYAIATILNAVVSGELISRPRRDEMLAERSKVAAAQAINTLRSAWLVRDLTENDFRLGRAEGDQP